MVNFISKGVIILCNTNDSLSLNDLLRKSTIENKIDVLTDLRKGLYDEIDTVTVLSHFYGIPTNFYSYSRNNTVHDTFNDIGGGSLKKFLDLFWFIPEDLNMTLKDNFVIDNATEKRVSFQFLLKQACRLLSIYKDRYTKFGYGHYSGHHDN